MKNAPNTPRPDRVPGGFWINYGLIVVGIMMTAFIAALLVAGWFVLSGGSDAGRTSAVPEGDKAAAGSKGDSFVDTAQLPAPRAVGQAPLIHAQAPVSRSTPPVPVTTGLKKISPDHPEDLQKQAEDAVRQFLEARTAQEKLAFVRHPGSVKGMMVSYYDVHHRADPKVAVLKQCEFIRLAGKDFAHLVYSAEGLFSSAEIALERMADGTMKIDWESLVGAGGMDWADFRQERPVEPVLLRALASLGTYYNFEFEETTRWLCVKLTSMDGMVIYAFVERGGDTARKLVPLLQDGSHHPVTVSVAFPERAASDNCVRLVGWLSDSWFVP